MDLDELRARAAAAAPWSIERTLWVVALIDAVLTQDVILIGGAAHNLYTGDYRPTDIDLAAPDVDRSTFRALTAAGFTDLGPGHRHIGLLLDDEEPPLLVEFPTSGSDIEATTTVQLTDEVAVQVISLEDLVVDRLIQATDRTRVTFEDAVALTVAAFDEIAWPTVNDRVDMLASEPDLGELPVVLGRVRAAAERAR